MKKILLLAVGMLSLQSCFVAKKYSRPSINTDDLYRSVVVAQDTLSLADTPWQELFTDPILQGYIQKGITQNFDIRTALESIKQSEVTLSQRKLGQLPVFSATTNWTHTEVKNLQTNQYRVAGNLSWEIDIWGKIRSYERSAAAQYLQSKAAHQAVQTQVVAAIASTYFQLLSLDAQLAIAKENLQNRIESLVAIEQLKQAGNVTAIAVKQMQAQRYATELIIDDLAYNITITEHALCMLLGESPQALQRGSFNTPWEVEIKTGIPARLLNKRPDVIAAEMALVNAFELSNVARASFYPSLSVSASGGFQATELSKWLSSDGLFANLVGAIAAPFFQQGQLKAQHKIAQSNQQKALIVFEKTLKTAGQEVSNALATYENETRKISLRSSQVAALKEAAAYSDELLNYGLANYLEVLTAKDNALNAELSLVNNRLSQYNAIISLYKALGGSIMQ